MHFTSRLFQEVCRQLEVKQNLSTAYHPQMDGQSERTNQTLEATLWIYCNHQQNDWARWLPILQYVLNSHVSTTTKQIPFVTWMGYLPRAHQPTREGEVPAVEERKGLMKQAREDAHEAMAKAQSFWNKRTTFRPYQKGQKVWIEGTNIRTTHPTTKLRAKRFGPFQITEVISPTIYCIQLPTQWKIHDTFHAALLHPHKTTELYGNTFVEPPPDLIAGHEEWEVENVLASRRQGRWKRLQYLIRWKGFLEAHDSWEPPENLENAHKAIKDFYHDNPRAIRCIVFKGQLMPSPSSSDLPLPELDELIIAFSRLYISMPSRDSSTENLVDRILDQPWRSPMNPATREPMSYEATSPTNEPSQPASRQSSPP
jgi:Chromo (CHRromatin Organisation MOdifier) domain